MTEQAATRRRGLGKGFEALLGTATRGQDLRHVPVGSIKPNSRQPRRRLDPEAITELTESVRAQGLLQPVVVRPIADGFELIAGERRWRAARAAGLATVPAVIREADDGDSLLLALVENVARADLSPVEEARAYAVLMDEFDLSLAEVADNVGRSKPTVSNRLRLLELPEDVLSLLERGELTEGHARAVLAVPDHDARRKLARQIVREGMSVRAAERAARWAGARTTSRTAKAAPFDPELTARAKAALERLSGAPVKVGAGRVSIAFADDAELGNLVEALEAALGRPSPTP